MFIVKANRDRPDFRVLIDLLYEPGREVDTSGNCRFPSDRSWTDVSIRDRESDAPSVSAWVPEDYWDNDSNCLELLFHIESRDAETEEAVAIYLYNFCGEYISTESVRLSEDQIAELQAKYATLIQRADDSRWHTIVDR